MIRSYLVTQDGLLNQPSVTVQADPGIAPAPHLRDAPGVPGPDLLRRGGTPGLQLSNGPGSKHSQSQSVLGMESGSRRSELTKKIESKYDWKTTRVS